ncbi:MAG: VanW family protein [Oscillospiraceae bacterium]|jgi:vancomycin resistance protein YoaR|nr:VanW family protein [Oscillospiraceae bacterium]
MIGNDRKTAAHLAPRSSKRKQSKKRAAPAAVAAVVIALFAALAGTGAVVVNASDAVFPNVYVGDVALGGLSETEAEKALRAGGYEAAAGGARAEVKLPNGGIISVTAEEAGLIPDAAEAAGRAYDYGRSGNIFAAGYAYAAGYLGVKTNLGISDLGTLDEDAVRRRVAEAVREFNLALGDGSFSVLQDRIEIIKGSGKTLADADAVYELVVETLYKAVEGKTSEGAEYTLPRETGGGVDLASIFNSVKAAPVSARYDTATKTIVEGARGVSFDMDAARDAVELAATGETVKIPLIVTEPEITGDMLRETLFRDVLAEQKTYIDGSSNRLTNITLASEAINGAVINPGDEFSFNGTVGERTAAKGYKSAGAYSGGRTVQEIGGGICQVSSTIYDCVLHADLKVTDRRNHQFIVTYLPIGNDATVNWGTTDFKFKNSTDYPLRIDATVDGRYLTVKIFGTKLRGGYITTESETISSKDFKTIEIEDESIEPGTTKLDTAGHYGCVVDTYKYRYDENGTLLEKEYVSRSTYNAQDKIILVPVGTLEAIETETPQISASPEQIDPESGDGVTEPTPNPYAPPDYSVPPAETDAPPEPTPEPVPSYTPPEPEASAGQTPPPATPEPEVPINGEI